MSKTPTLLSVTSWAIKGLIIDSTEYDLTEQWIMIRPNANFTKLKLLSKDPKAESWKFITLLDIPSENLANLKNYSWGTVKWLPKKRV